MFMHLFTVLEKSVILLKTPEIQMRGSSINLKIHPQGLTFDFADVSVASIDKFSKNCFCFQILLFFQSTDLSLKVPINP